MVSPSISILWHSWCHYSHQILFVVIYSSYMDITGKLNAIHYLWMSTNFFLWNLCKEFPQFHVNSFNNEVLYRYLSITIYCNIHYGDQAFIFYVEWEGIQLYFCKRIELFFYKACSDFFVRHQFVGFWYTWHISIFFHLNALGWRELFQVHMDMDF